MSQEEAQEPNIVSSQNEQQFAHPTATTNQGPAATGISNAEALPQKFAGEEEENYEFDEDQ